MGKQMFLFLTRRCEEQTVLVVPPSTTPTVIVSTIDRIKGPAVVMRWQADRAVSIDRKEIYDAKQRDENARRCRAKKLPKAETLIEAPELATAGGAS